MNTGQRQTGLGQPPPRGIRRALGDKDKHEKGGKMKMVYSEGAIT